MNCPYNIAMWIMALFIIIINPFVLTFIVAGIQNLTRHKTKKEN